MPESVSRHKIEVSVFPTQPMDAGLRKVCCEYHEYIAHVVGEYVMECAANCKDRGNISVRMGENEPWTDFSICDHHADIIEKRLSSDPEGDAEEREAVNAR